jgi:NhaC family Na+:H+ antiporter
MKVGDKSMPFLFALSVLIGAIFFCVIFGYSILFGLSAGALAFFVAALWKGHTLKEILPMMGRGIRDSFIVIRILLLIGAMTGIWRISGTIPYLVYYGIQLIAPQTFILLAFLLSSAVSYLIGTSIGTCGTIGVVLMVLAEAGGVSPLITAGAVISGAYFGDRASPASSCANLVAFLTSTELYDNVKRMLKDTILPMGLVTATYAGLSLLFPLKAASNNMSQSIAQQVTLSPWLLLPVFVILLAPFLKVKIRDAMAVSIGIGFVLAAWIQQQPIALIFKALLTGYTTDIPALKMFQGGGMWSMKNAILIILISATFSGILKGTDMLSDIWERLEQWAQKMGVFPVMTLTSIPVSAIACNQTLSLILEAQLTKPLYERRKLPNTQMMLDMSNSTVTIAGLIPWNTACAIPLSLLGASYAAIPWAVYLWLLPILGIFKVAIFSKKGKID